MSQHFLAAKTRKEDHYDSLLSDLQHAGYVVDLVTIEVGCLGHFMPENVFKLSTVCHLPKRSINQILQRALVLPFPLLTGNLTPAPLCYGCCRPNERLM